MAQNGRSGRAIAGREVQVRRRNGGYRWKAVRLKFRTGGETEHMMADNQNANKCTNPLDNDAQIKAYFNTLPAFVQENIKQTGIQICSVEDLKKCAQNLTQGE